MPLTEKLNTIFERNMKYILTLKIFLIITTFALPNFVRAESIDCKGTLPPDNTTRFQIETDLGKTHLKSTIRYFLPDGSTYTQAIGINARKIKSDKLSYYDDSGGAVIEVTVKDGKLQNASFSNPKSDDKLVPVTCELFGDIPSPELCPTNKNLNLITAIRSANDVNAISRAIECGGQVNFADDLGCTPLMFAFDASCGIVNSPFHGAGAGAFSKTKDIVDLLINSGAYVNVVDKSGESPLIKAVRNNIQNVYDSFLAAEVDIDSKDKNGMNALMYAAIGGDPSIVSDLLLGNPDRRIKNGDGLTAYDLAVHWERARVIDLLKVPDLTIAIVGSADGLCSPLSIDFKLNQTVELTLKGAAKMFKFESKKLNVDLMTAPDQVTHKIFVASLKGDYPFTCGVHGSATQAAGIIHVN